VSAQGSPHRCGRKEAWWEEGAGEADNAAPRSGVERSRSMQRKAAGSAGSAVRAGIVPAATRTAQNERSGEEEEKRVPSIFLRPRIIIVIFIKNF
jgi:hypothetical protein